MVNCELILSDQNVQEELGGCSLNITNIFYCVVNSGNVAVKVFGV